MSEFSEKTRALVVGGAGFVGSNLTKKLLASGVGHVQVVDNLLSSEPENLPDDKRVSLLVGSIADDCVLARIEDDYDYVFHLATYHGNQSSIHDPIADHQNNAITTLKLFWRLKGFKRLKKLVYAGAGCAVAEKTEKAAVATKEDAPVSLLMDSPYSISKMLGEYYAVYFHNAIALPVVRARFQNVYGPGEVLGAGQWRGTPATVWRNVIPTFVYRSLHGMPIELYNAGNATRDFIFVEDLVNGLIACALKGAPGDVYNLATGKETSILNLAKTINELAGGKSKLELKERRSWDHSINRFGCPEKSKEKLGFIAKVELDEGLKRTVEWTKENMPFIEKCVAKHKSHMPS